MKRIKGIAMCAVAALTFTACSNGSNEVGNNSSQQKQEEAPKSAIDSLSAEEKEIFDALIIASDAFYNPQTIKVMSVENHFGTRISDGTLHKDYYGPRCAIEISAENKVGGSFKKTYFLWTDDYWLSDELENVASNTDFLKAKKGAITEYDTKYRGNDPRPYDDVNIGNLNRALTQHWEDLGLL